MITPKDRAKFMNFGLSRFTGRRRRPRLSAAAPYVAPEELAGQAGRFAQRHLFARRRDVRDAHRPAARARAGAERPESERACRSSNRSSAGCSRPTSSIARRAPRRSRPSSAASRRFSIRAPKRPRPPRRPSPRGGARERGAAACRRDRHRRAGRCCGAIAAWMLVAMIIETRAVPPFQKNGYVVACETTREAVVIDPGDEVDMLLDVVARAVAERAEHSADACPRRSRDGRRRARSRRCRFRCTCIATISFSTTRRLSRRHSSGCTATRCRRSIATTILPTTLSFGEYEVGVHHTPGHCPGGVCLAIGSEGSDESRICSSAIRCLPARSAGRICRAAITRR